MLLISNSYSNSYIRFIKITIAPLHRLHGLLGVWIRPIPMDKKIDDIVFFIHKN